MAMEITRFNKNSAASSKLSQNDDMNVLQKYSSENIPAAKNDGECQQNAQGIHSYLKYLPDFTLVNSLPKIIF